MARVRHSITGRLPSVGSQSGARRGSWDMVQGVWNLLQLLLVVRDKWLQMIIPYLFHPHHIGIKATQYTLCETCPDKVNTILPPNRWEGVSGGFHYSLSDRWMGAPWARFSLLLFHSVASVFKNETYVKGGRWLRLPNETLMPGNRAELMHLLYIYIIILFLITLLHIIFLRGSMPDLVSLMGYAHVIY